MPSTETNVTLNLVTDMRRMVDSYGANAVARALHDTHPEAFRGLLPVASFPARAGDPETSDAAASRHSTTDVGRFRTDSTKARLLGAFAERPRTAYIAATVVTPHDGLDARAWATRAETARKRVSELTAVGFIKDSGQRRKNPGSPDPSIVWQITEAGQDALRRIELTGCSR